MPDEVESQLVAALRVLCMAIGAGLLLVSGAASRAGRGQGSVHAEIATARSYLEYVHLERGQAPEPQVLDGSFQLLVSA